MSSHADIFGDIYLLVGRPASFFYWIERGAFMLTILEISKILGVSKSTARRYLQKIGAEPVESFGGTGVNRYDESVVERIKTEVFGSKQESKPDDESEQERFSEPIYDALLNQLELLQKQLQVKDSQIERLQQMLNQEQQLNAMNIQKIQQLEDKQTTQVSQDQEQSKEPWWKKLLNLK